MDTATISILNVLIDVMTVFILAIYLGVELIGKVPSLLHTPLMSGSNAISGITVVGAILALQLTVGHESLPLGLPLIVMGTFAMTFAMINVAGGFVVTHRMLDKFKPRKSS